MRQDPSGSLIRELRAARSALVASLLIAGCSSSGGHVVTLTGSWGGTNVELEGTPSGATFHFKCGARGQASSALRLDSQGRFDAAGTEARTRVPCPA
jgi:hypothetical protein